MQEKNAYLVSGSAVSANLLNPVLFSILGDPITLAKVLSIAGLGLDIWGVLLLLTHDLRVREAAVQDTSQMKDLRDSLKAKVERAMGSEVIRRAMVMLRPHLEARETLRKTRMGFRLLLAGFILQLLGTLAS